MKKITLFLYAAFILICTSCSTPRKTAGNYYTHKTECISAELDGTQVVNAWANTGEKINAIEQAKKNAVNDILFGGIVEGKTVCNNKPILAAANIKTNNEAYFNRFFADGGEYRAYTALKDENVADAFAKDDETAKKMLNSGFVIRVNSQGLRDKMIADGILKQ